MLNNLVLSIMTENVELNGAILGLQTQMDALQTQFFKVLRALADQFDTMRTIQKQSDESLLAFRMMIQQFQNYQLQSDSQFDSLHQQLQTQWQNTGSLSGLSTSSRLLPTPQPLITPVPLDSSPFWKSMKLEPNLMEMTP